jgi:hypothetical protein
VTDAKAVLAVVGTGRRIRRRATLVRMLTSLDSSAGSTSSVKPRVSPRRALPAFRLLKSTGFVRACWWITSSAAGVGYRWHALPSDLGSVLRDL